MSLAPGLFCRCHGPFFKQAGKREQRVQRQPGLECRLIGLADNLSVRCRVRHLIQPLQQQTLLENSESRGDPAVRSGFCFNRFHITECTKSDMSMWRQCDGNVKITRQKAAVRGWQKAEGKSRGAVTRC